MNIGSVSRFKSASTVIDVFVVVVVVVVVVYDGDKKMILNLNEFDDCR